MSKDPAFLFYPNDYIGGTMGMTFEEKGAYIELLMLQFNRGHMTSHMIGQTVGQLWDKIHDKFIKDDKGFYYNQRLDIEIENRKAYVSSRYNNLKGTNQYSKIKGHMTSHMENENINYISLFNKVIKENKIELTDEFKSLIIEWLKYKSEKRQTYKETGLKSLLIKVMNDTNGDAEELRQMILYSTSKNYDGLFKEKNNGTNKKNNGATSEEILGAVNKYFPIEGYPK
jgi:uncharacterized protein YdaU (DUF1376 family)